MTEDRVTPNWKGPVFWSVLLVVSMLGQIPLVDMLRDRPAFIVGTLWNLLNSALAVVAYFSWSAQIKQTELFNTTRGESYRPSTPFFIIWAVATFGSALVVVLFGEAKLNATLDTGIAIVSGILWTLLLIRAVLMGLVRIVSGRKDELPKRFASAFADGILILGVAVALYPKTEMGSVRFIILTVVMTSIRVAWGYVPEERLEIVREFFVFLRERKLWWMTPIFIILGLLVVLVLLTESTGGSFPFIYAVF